MDDHADPIGQRGPHMMPAIASSSSPHTTHAPARDDYQDMLGELRGRFEERRNPVSWYVYPGGSTARQWNLEGGSQVKVNAITLLPCMWNEAGDHGNHGAGVVFILDGCKDTAAGSGLALFPETLKSEYHGVRSVIERYSRGAQLEGRELASACGLDVRKGRATPITVLVTSKAGALTEYTIDRWD
jgi:hypothetical protein